MEEWLLCPMVGEVANNKAVIVFEIKDKSKALYVKIEQKDKVLVNVNDIGTTRIILSFRYPSVYQIYWYLEEDIIYTHKVHNCPKDKLIVVSCDKPSKDTKHSLWKTMENEVKNNHVAILHLGDQIYADKEYKECKKLQLHTKSDNDEHLIPTYYHLYSQRYRKTYATHHNILSNTSNYYIWDDHELHNNATIDLNDNVDLIAIACYKEYQSFQLEEEYFINDYCWYKFIGKILVIVIERTSEIISIDTIITHVIPLLKDVTKVILSFTSAPIPPPHNNMSGLIYTTIMGTGKFFPLNKLDQLLQWLFNIEQEVILLGGDMHCGLVGKYVKNDKIIQVLVASPITNHPYFDRHIIARGLKGITDICGNIQFVVTNAKAKRCYGVVDLKDFTASMVYSNYMYPRALKNII